VRDACAGTIVEELVMQSWKIPAVLMAACLASGFGTALAAREPERAVSIAVLSSPPEYVSGGDARIAVRGGAPDAIALWLNGRAIAPPLVRHGDRLEAVVTGLAAGTNVLEVRARRGKPAVLDTVRLTNYPRTGPMFTGPQQMPFICRTEESGLGQPLVDNRQGIGHPVRDAAGERIVGHSRYCGIARTTAYFYHDGKAFKPFDPATGFDAPPADMQTVAPDGTAVPFIVRVETGTINRFLYTIAMLAPFRETGRQDDSAWNRKLVYWLRGGVGIGHQQGMAISFGELRSAERRVFPRILEQGYALVSSSGNETGVHYNMRLAEETAMMTKEYFIETHGMPLFTIGLGGSGGAVQQYLFAQNRPGLLDGGVPIQSYPDMITQTIPITDCPLLEQYFQDEAQADPASRWRRWSERRLVEGMNASDTEPHVITGEPGSSECLHGWLKAIPTVLNPLYRHPQFDAAAKRYRYPPDVFRRVTWTHWNDLANIHGVDDAGFSPDSVDNVGVQYGLSSLVQGAIGADEFLRINACVGGWKPQRDFVPWAGFDDPFDSRNMLRSATCRQPEGSPAPRRAGAVEAMRRAYTSGHVFTGQRLGIPVIDLRPWLEPKLDMHNARQAFSVRARLRGGNRDAAANQVIWFTGSADDVVARGMSALGVIDRYLSGGAAPAEFTDACFDAKGAPIAAGPAVWDGILDRAAPGKCTAAYPVHASPRMVAGDAIEGSVFKCALKSVAAALGDGTYGPVAFTAAQRRWLERIFPDGVCDYARGDMGRPQPGS
jgi:hypothetical protein